MKARLAILGLLIALTLEVHACPRCTYERMVMENWHIKYCLASLIVPLFVVGNRLDVIRFSLVLVPYVAFSHWFHSYLFWHTFPGDSPLAILGWLIWSLNLLGVGLLYAISPLPFFRWNKGRPLARWQPVAYALAMFIAQFIVR